MDWVDPWAVGSNSEIDQFGKGKGYGRVEKSQNEKRALVRTEGVPLLRSQDERRESDCCDGHAGEGGEKRP